MVKKTARPHILKIKPYQPGKPIEEVAREIGVKEIEEISKLASNENPLGPSPLALKAIRKALPRLNLYPDGSGYYLKQGLSERLGIPPEQIILGNGSNEIIELIMHVFVGPGHNIVYAHPSFLVYRLMAHIFGVRGIEVPLGYFTHDLGAMARAVNAETQLVFIANPNNPTGTAVLRQEIEEFLDKIPPRVITVLDEAYYEYLPDSMKFDSLSLVNEKKVVVLRTFSKLYGLAGLRIGYGIASRDCVEVLNRVRQPFNTNSLAQAAALAALDDEEHVRRTLRVNRKGLERLNRAFQDLGLDYVPSFANFILVKVGRGQEIFQRLLQRGIIVRPMDFYGLPEYIRVTVGRPEENEKFLRELKKLLKK